MSRWTVGAFAAIGIAVLVAGWVEYHGTERYSLSADVQQARKYLQLIDSAEIKCFDLRGRYLTLDELGPRGCGNLDGAISTGAHDGYLFEVKTTDSRYTVRVHAASAKRLISLYSDEERKVHLGTREKPATSQSPLL